MSCVLPTHGLHIIKSCNSVPGLSMRSATARSYTGLYVGHWANGCRLEQDGIWSLMLTHDKTLDST